MAKIISSRLIGFCITEDSGRVESEIMQNYDNARRRLEADYKQVLQKLHALRQTEAKRLQKSLSDLETSRLELQGLGERLSQLASRGTDAEILQENFTPKWKPSGLDDGSGFVIAFRQNTLLSRYRTNVIGQLQSTVYVTNNDGNMLTTRIHRPRTEDRSVPVVIP